MRPTAKRKRRSTLPVSRIPIILFMLLSYVTCFSQTTFQGITPGKSTRPEVERVFGRSVKQVSPTLVEYAPKQIKLKTGGRSVSSGKIYAQYRDGSNAAIVDRLEMIVCRREGDVFPADCDLVSMHQEFDPGSGVSADGTLDAYRQIDDANGFKVIRHMGAPRYMARTDIARNKGPDEIRWAFYSRELYESIAPTGNCLGTFGGEWETNLGRMTISRIDAFGGFRGTYAKNEGSFTGTRTGDTLSGEWKDSTGSGSLYLSIRPLPGEKSFTGSWTRTTGSGPKTGQWEGRCVETN
jgi:hypothetical protein